jgi:hypothetical protein
MSNDLLCEAVRAMTVSEFVSERFVEAVLAKASILNTEKERIRKARSSFEHICNGRNPNRVGALLDKIEGNFGQVEILVGHSGDTASLFRRYAAIVLQGGNFSAEGRKVLDILGA